MEWTIITTVIILAFLCGSIPAGYLIVKELKGIDIRTVGSGNIGSTNVKRVAGSRASLLTQATDILKGLIPVTACLTLSRYLDLKIDTDVFTAATALAAILGHDFSPFMNFRGGKGVNTTVGAFGAIAPLPTVLVIIVYFILRSLTGIVSVGSMASGVALPVAVGFFEFPQPILIGSVIAGCLVIVRHIDNIVRLAKGEEKEVGTRNR